MEDSTVFIIGAIVAVIVFVIILSGRKKKKTTSAAPTTAPGTFRGTLPVNPTPTPAPPSKPATTPVPPPKRPEGGTRNSVFSYTARSAVWVCPNCACENSPDSTHCCVCFWDKSVGVK